MNVVAWVSLVFAAFAVIAGPFEIGKLRKPMTAVGYVLVIAQAVTMALLSGRVLGWW